MGIWTVPTVIVCILIGVVSFFLSLGVMRKTSRKAQVTDTPIPKTVREHPMVLNPIILMYIIFLLFTGLIIFYYWAKYGY